jgi:hypothetical protein
MKLLSRTFVPNDTSGAILTKGGKVGSVMDRGQSRGMAVMRPPFFRTIFTVRFNLCLVVSSAT